MTRPLPPPGTVSVALKPAARVALPTVRLAAVPVRFVPAMLGRVAGNLASGKVPLVRLVALPALNEPAVKLTPVPVRFVPANVGAVLHAGAVVTPPLTRTEPVATSASLARVVVPLA